MKLTLQGTLCALRLAFLQVGSVNATIVESSNIRGAHSALPPPCGHTTQISPSHPNADREWYPDAAAFGKKYEPQDGPITELPRPAECVDLKSSSTNTPIALTVILGLVLFIGRG